MITLTKLQIEIVEHRLEVPDAIYEACESAIESYTVEDFDEAVRNVSKMIQGEFTTAAMTNVEWLIFEDAIEGSTLPDAADDAAGYPIDAGGISQQKATAIRTAHEKLYKWFVGHGDLRLSGGLDK